ncbi:MAG: NAD(P)H-dependent oxidoreductase subunit E [Deltaproteobacteria bacterium]|nr:NAD(P)H-dependent oxidoreductase subunit E [Deltaproteobacteria bacterium]
MFEDARVAAMREAHEVLARVGFEVTPIEKGCANRYLRIDLSTGAITIHPVDQRMKDLWTGGKGFDLWLMFLEINKNTRWDSPENPICFATGPLGGTASFPGSGKTLLTTISPLTNIVIDSNVGGYFGPYLKFAGFDALVITGKAKKESMILIDAESGGISIETCPQESLDSHLVAEELTAMYARDDLDRRNVSVVSAGRGADHTRMGLLNFSFWDWRRGVARLKQAGRGGVGTVFRDKRLKALVVRNRDITPAWRVSESKVARLPSPEIPAKCCGDGVRQEIDAIIDRWRGDREYALEMMQDVQERFRHIPKTALDHIGKRTGAPRAQLYHIATFYKEFSLTPRGETAIQVCMGTACHVKGAARILDSFERILSVKAGETTTDGRYSLEAVACLGSCEIAPVVKIGDEVHGDVETRHVEKLLKRHAAGRKQSPAPTAGPGPGTRKSGPASAPEPGTADHAVSDGQRLIALRNKGLVDPEEIDTYIARGGYAALRKAISRMRPEEVVAEVIASGLRGRGGGGFPTGFKWQAARNASAARSQEVHVVCNCTGALMERSLVEADPHSVLEGMTIGAFAVGAHEGHINVRKEYALAKHRLEIAIEAARGRGLLGKNILGLGFDFDIRIRRGAGAFICGESSALIASISGRVGEPQPKYVHHTERGFRDRPTVLNNVETWATVPVIFERGAKWFASIGAGGAPRNGSSGTKVLSLAGKVRNTGLVEVPMGIPLREIVEGAGGGVPGGRALKAVQIGGPSGGCLPAGILDMPLDFDSLGAAGSIMGSGGLIVMDERTCMVDVARHFTSFLADESCGKCTPCREGLFALDYVLTRICRGEGRPEDLGFLEELSQTVRDTSLCQFGGTAPNPALSTIRYFRNEYESHIRDKKCPAGVCKSLIHYSINEKCNGCGACVKPCPSAAISGVKKALHVLDRQKCLKCGICREVCRFEAVEVG